MPQAFHTLVRGCRLLPGSPACRGRDCGAVGLIYKVGMVSSWSFCSLMKPE